MTRSFLQEVCRMFKKCVCVSSRGMQRGKEEYDEESVDIDYSFTLYVSVIGAIFSVIVVAKILRDSGMVPVEDT